MKDRASTHRRAPLTPFTHPQPSGSHPRITQPTRRAHEPVRPTQPRQIPDARGLVGKPRLQLLERRRVINSRNRLQIRHADQATSLKQIRTTYVRITSPTTGKHQYLRHLLHPNDFRPLWRKNRFACVYRRWTWLRLLLALAARLRAVWTHVS